MANAENRAWKENIKKWANDLGFIAVGFTSAEKDSILGSRLENKLNQGFATPFESTDVKLRTDPRAVWTLCQTVVALAYPLPLSTPADIKEGIIARSAVGEDYHQILKRNLELLIKKILESGWPSQPPRFQVDTGPLVERTFAARAGIGWIGRNRQLLVPGYGSFVALALLLLDQELPPDHPITDQCGECLQCIRACPAKVLGNEDFRATECLSYLTQSKETLTFEQTKKLDRKIFGCDTCQEVCPHNHKRLKQERELSNQEDTELHCGVDLYEMLNLSKKDFDRLLRHTAAGWRGKTLLQRNALLALKKNQDQRLNEWVAQLRKEGNISPHLAPYLDMSHEE